MPRSWMGKQSTAHLLQLVHHLVDASHILKANTRGALTRERVRQGKRGEIGREREGERGGREGKERWMVRDK